MTFLDFANALELTKLPVSWDYDRYENQIGRKLDAKINFF
jgi:hypothetical protein